MDAAITWPHDVRKSAEAIADLCRGTRGYVEDLRVPAGCDEDFRQLFVGRALRAYHATRLLHHEGSMIRAQGLRMLSEDLVVGRIQQAHELGHLSPEERNHLLSGHVFVEGREHGRAGHASLFISRTPLDRMLHGVWPLLTTWGGEGIYMAQGGHSMRDKLRALGVPTVVVVDVDLGPDPAVHGIYPELWKLFAARLLGRQPLSADLLYKASVPPEGVVALWKPGDPEYDKHKRLPRE